MLRTVLVVPVDGAPSAQLVDVGTGWLDWLYQTCDTRMIEHFEVADGVCMYGDEEGRLRAGWQVNQQATALVRALIDQDEEEMREGWDLIGTIVFVGTELYHIDADGEDDPIDASVPDRVLDLVSLH